MEPHWALGPSNLVVAIDYQGNWSRARPLAGRNQGAEPLLRRPANSLVRAWIKGTVVPLTTDFSLLAFGTPGSPYDTVKSARA